MRRVLLGALVLVALAAAADAWRLSAVQRTNARIDAARAGQAPDGELAAAAPQVRFAYAYAQAASGAHDTALNHYGALQDDSVIGNAARYNAANLLLREAMKVRAGPQPGQALPLIELAKENYRAILRTAPDDWSARYNLERAQRLVPEPDDADDGPPELPRSAERAPTTMRGYSPGLP